MLHRFLRAALTVPVVTAATLAAVAVPAYALTATFQGTMTDAVTGAPAADVCVQVWRVQGYTAYEQQPVPCTGPDGTWTVSGLDAGTYVVEARGRYWVTQYAYGESDLWQGHRFSVVGGQTTVVDLAMEPGGVVTGTVTDATTGQPVAGACADVLVTNGTIGACAGDDGRYVVAGVRPGSWPVWFTAGQEYTSEYAHDAAEYTDATPVAVVAGQDAVLDEDLMPAGAVSGTVTDAATGLPLAGVCLAATPEPVADVTTNDCTDAAGRYRIAYLPSGSYHVLADDPAGAHPRTFAPGTTDPAQSVPVTVAGGAEVTGVDIAVTEAAFLSGTVTRAATGAPLEGVCVSAVTLGGQSVRGAFGPDVCSDAAGRYTVRGLPAGDVHVHFSPTDPALLAQWAYGAESPADADPVTLVAGQTTAGVDAAMTEGAKIRGRVVDALTKRPVEGVCATYGVYSARGGLDLEHWPPACTGPDGRYEISGLRSGSYTIEFYDPTGSYAWEFHPGVARRADATPVAVTAGTVTVVDAALRPGGRIEGVVLDAAGNPAARVCAEAFQASSQDPVGTYACTGADGRYTLRGLPTTDVRVRFAGRGYVTEWAVDQQSFATATTLPTVAGGVTPLPAVVARTP